MKSTLATFIIMTFLALSLLHFYWASGGEWAYDHALPATEDGVRMLNPGVVDCLVVGLGLLLCGILYLQSNDWLNIRIPYNIQRFSLWVIPIIFTLRAVGDFKYVGFFKQIRATEFARLDTIFYSPLCLVIGLAGFMFLRLTHRPSEAMA